MADPWTTAKTETEHSEQIALFQYCNMAAMFGWEAANDPLSYTLAGHAVGRWGKPDWTGEAPSPGIYAVPVLSRLHAIHNQGHGDAIRGARAAAEGLKLGVPDVFLPVPRYICDVLGNCFWDKHGLYIELKRRKPHQSNISANQKDWIAYLNEAGYKAVVCYGWEEAADVIKEYLS